MEEHCQNCGTVANGPYCSNCGFSRKLERIDKNYAVNELLNLIGFEKGFVFTCRELLLKPGKTINEYISTNRQKITKPISFLVLTSVIYTLISHYLKTDTAYSEPLKKMYGDSALYDITIWVQDNYGYANLMMILPITLWTRLFFRKYAYNFYETFAVISFVMGMGMLFFALEPLLNNISAHTFILNETVVFLIAFTYMGWAIGQFYGRRIRNYIKAFLAYIFGMLTFQVIAFGAGIMYDLLTK